MNSSRRKTLVTLAFAVLILLPSMFGFATKFYEFVQTFRGESGGIFAITPMVNYVLASLGFLCLLVWAALNGMFRDLERPKELMLERERLLDRERPA
jgi:hypothetical protein